MLFDFATEPGSSSPLATSKKRTHKNGNPDGLTYLQLLNTTTDTSKANGYASNVSAREGISESFPTSSQKAGYHTHTPTWSKQL